MMFHLMIVFGRSFIERATRHEPPMSAGPPGMHSRTAEVYSFRDFDARSRRRRSRHYRLGRRRALSKKARLRYEKALMMHVDAL